MSIQSIIEAPVKEKRFSKGEMIYQEGNTARYFYEVKIGEVKMVSSNEDGKEFIQGIYKTGESFGVPSLLCDKFYPASAFANTDCEIYVVSKEQFLSLLEHNYDFHLSITKMMSERILFKTMMLQELAGEEGEHRLFSLIHYLMAQKEVDNKTLAITKQQLADMTGLRVETVIRIMKNIEDKGMIRTTRGNIVCDLHDKNH